jgi:dihydrofolate reductase
VVLSHRDLAPNVPRAVTASREKPTDLAARLSAEGKRHIYVDGGITVQSFLSAGLVDGLTITVIPVLLGTGKPLFGPLPSDVHLSHVSTHVYEFGFVQHKYRVRRAA